MTSGSASEERQQIPRTVMMAMIPVIRRYDDMDGPYGDTIRQERTADMLVTLLAETFVIFNTLLLLFFGNSKRTTSSFDIHIHTVDTLSLNFQGCHIPWPPWGHYTVLSLKDAFTLSNPIGPVSHDPSSSCDVAEKSPLGLMMRKGTPQCRCFNNNNNKSPPVQLLDFCSLPQSKHDLSVYK